MVTDDEQLPSGTVTFLLTDIEDSTTLWEHAPDAMARAMERHDEIVRRTVANHGGIVHRARGEGDSQFALFTDAAGALSAIVDIHTALAAEAWPTRVPIRIRAGLATAHDAAPTPGGYYGSPVNRCARLRSLASGGQTLVSITTAEAAKGKLPEGTELVDLGTFVLRGISSAERVLDLRRPGGPVAPPLRGHVINLPLNLANLVGRARELDALHTALASQRLVTLIGPGGVGKTSLALHLAEASGSAFPDGAFWVDLAPITDPSRVAQTIASTLAVRIEPQLTTEGTIAASLHDKEVLVVLDNCEQVLGVVVDLVEELLRAAPRLKVLATSREALGLAGEIATPVEPLRLPDQDKVDAVELIRHDATRLFIERARQAARRFEITDANAHDVLRICRLVDGLPLGIELAASSVRALSVDQIAERLANAMDLPSTGRRPARHRTLEAAVAWSYDLLTPDEQRLLRELSVFVGGASLEAIERVCGADTLDRLAILIDRSLVTVDDGVDDRTRYGMLDTIRRFAVRELETSGETDDVHARHLRHFVRFGEVFAREVSGAEQRAWFARLDQEIDNIRAALSWSVTHDPVGGLALAGALDTSWFMRSRVAEGKTFLENLLSAAPDAGPLRIRAQQALGFLVWHLGDYETGVSHMEAALEAAREEGVPEWVAMLTVRLAMVATLHNDAARALPVVEEGIEAARRSGSDHVRGAMLSSAANALRNTDLARSRQLAEEGVDVLRRFGVPSEIASALLWLGSTAIEQGDVETARAALCQALEVRRDLDDLGGAGVVIRHLAMLAAREGDAERALRLAGASFSLRDRAGWSPPGHDLEERLDTYLDALGPQAQKRRAELWAEGGALSNDDAIAYALADSAPTRQSVSQAITDREREVAVLLTESLTNREIAKRLVISPRTVDAHVEHIRNKLGLRTRAQIAAWVTSDTA